MKRFLVLVSVAIISVGLICGCMGKGGNSSGVEKQVGDYNVVMRLSNDPPVNGDNDVFVTIKDKAGVAVVDAKVKVDYIMPAMPGMPAMNYSAEAMYEENEYRASVNFSMSGSWNLIIVFNIKGVEQKASFSIDVK